MSDNPKIRADGRTQRATIPSQDALRVLQITDTHLFADPGQTLLGVNTLDSFRSVLRRIEEDGFVFDLILATGDLVQEPTPDAYQRFAEEIARLEAPAYSLPGNHDNLAQMERQFDAAKIATLGDLETAHWHLILLDSVVPGQDGGRLAPSELERLERTLSLTSKHVLVTLHHQPVPMGSAWLDTMQMENPSAFFDVIDRNPHVRMILWGHVHQSFDAERRGIRMLATPSTCVQFAPGSESFQVHSSPPGCRLLTLLPDGTIETEVLWVDATPAGIDQTSAGY